METNRQVISDVVGSLHSLSIDDRMSNRFILSKVRDKANVLLKQDTDSRRLFTINDLWKRIKCLHMKPVSLVECDIDVPDCSSLMKSVEKIPSTFSSAYGDIVKVFTLLGGSEYKQTSFARYKDIVRREVIDTSFKYYWIEDGHIFIPNSSVAKVTVVGLFRNPEEVDVLNGDAADCVSPLDQPFPIPQYILSVAKDMAVQELAGIYKRIPADEKADLNTNIKS